MPLTHHTSFTNSYLFNSFPSSTNPSLSTSIFPLSFSRSNSCRIFKFPKLSIKNDIFEGFKDTHLPKRGEHDEELEGLELLNKPSPKQVGDVEAVEEVKNVDADEFLVPFYKLFMAPEEEIDRIEGEIDEGLGKIGVECYEPKQGDFVVGVVVSGNENKLDVNVGADMLGTMLTKEVLPLYDKEMGNLLCDVEKDAEEFLVHGKVGILRSDEVIGGAAMLGRPVVDVGTVLFAEVLGRTLGGRPLLSCRKLFRRIAWHRVRQIMQLNEPILVQITEWNTGGLLARIEGLRAFLPKAELVIRVNNYTELKENVGRRLYVQITRINENTNDLILSEKEAWVMMHLQEGTLLDGTVGKIFPYGAQIRIGDTNRSGLLHISNISRGHTTAVSDYLAFGDEVKVLVIKSMFPEKISLSIAELESEPGLFLSNREKVFLEAEEMAKKYRRRMASVSATRELEALPIDGLPFGDEEKLYANWQWFKFERDNALNP
ncbi:protein PIGMENT DEFECTIVE 338, chloroplastic-like protein [Salvia divinorum]|uniref:Protein PIGMENT DEFECTIVE 338, chloroplastic-like protein n=1 Tax=Salvia divinorum TaxID=28513 RepID=A0ABD1GSJ3_SALDI